ncbi:MAG: hypothetical protein M1816_004225 [Peltula sp. TS41687]|nr:MAG: hypothetical protein M1816_004225 [Peltula sp. TS41687]
MSPSVDFTRYATYPISIGESVSGSGGGGGGLAGFRYNHMPPQTATKRTKRFYPSKAEPDRGKIRIIDGEEDGAESVWTYEAKRVVKPSYILVLGETSERYRLEKFELDYDCNLVSTPSESDKAVLRARYSQIDRGKDSEKVSAEKSRQDEDDESYLDDPIDENSPYDFRRWMRGDFNWFLEKDSKPQGKSASPNLSDRGSINGVEHHTKSSDRNYADDDSSPNDVSQELKRKAPAYPTTLKPKAKARKITQPESDLGTAASSQTLQALDDELTIDFDPDTRPERDGGSHIATSPPADDASQSVESEAHQEEDQDESSDDDLVIEMEEDTRQKRTIRGLHTPMGNGAPISLRSAASSISPPATPGGPTQESDEEASHTRQNGDGQREEVKADDVYEAPESPAADLQDDGDDEDELEAQLAQALESEDYQPHQEQQPEEESEEE